MKLTILVGLPGSKKSTWARENKKDNEIIVNRDTIRMNNFGVYWGEPIDEHFVTQLERQQMIAAFENGFDIISDNTNLNSRNTQRLVDLAAQFGAEVDFKYFDMPPETAIKYDENRGDKKVGAKVINRMARKAKIENNGFIPRYIDLYLHKIKPYTFSGAGIPVFIVDIDGTIAIKGDRSPYDYSKVHLDTTNANVVSVVETLSSWAKIIYLSGRNENCREQTEKWLKDWKLPEGDLFMRPANDPRTPDYIVKDRLFDHHIKSNYNVIGVADDRRQVVQMWRTKGLTVFDVAGNKF